jgi:hypothetical protein
MFLCFVHRACSGVGECNVRGHCECPPQYTGVDCAEGAPGAVTTTAAAAAAAAAAAVTPDGRHDPAHNLDDDAQGAESPCPTLWAGAYTRSHSAQPELTFDPFRST